MSEICKAFISGNIVKDAEQRMTQDGLSIVRFSVAVNKRKKQGGEWVNVPHYFDFVMFGNYGAAICESLTKGTKVCLDCEPEYSSWEKDGKRNTKIEFIAQTVVFVKQKNEQPGLYDEDCPF